MSKLMPVKKRLITPFNVTLNLLILLDTPRVWKLENAIKVRA